MRVPLTLVFIVKIVVTVVCWCVPLLLFPPSLFERFGIPAPEPIIFARLVGAAYFALLFVYWHGWTEARRGNRSVVAIRAGLVSNGLAAALMVGYGLAGAWDRWGPLGQTCMWISAAAAALITAGLLVGRTRSPSE